MTTTGAGSAAGTPSSISVGSASSTLSSPRADLSLSRSGSSRIPSQARWRFNTNPKRAIEWLLSPEGSAAAGSGAEYSATEIAEWFLADDGVSSKAVGEWLGGPSELQVAVLKAYASMLELGTRPFDAALRYYLSKFKLPGEAQQIDRIMQAFAEGWSAGGSGGPEYYALSAETAHVLAFSTIMLNTDLHSPQIAHKMTLEQFVSNNRGIGPDGTDLPRALLESLYASIKSDEVQIEQREYIWAATAQGWLLKQGGRHKSWKRRWVILSGSVLFYFASNKDPQPKGVFPLEKVRIKASDARPFAFALCSVDGSILKSSKRAADGTMMKGTHVQFIFAAETEADRAKWMRALRDNVQQARHQRLLLERALLAAAEKEQSSAAAAAAAAGATERGSAAARRGSRTICVNGLELEARGPPVHAGWHVESALGLRWPGGSPHARTHTRAHRH